METDKFETYYLATESGTTYFQVREDGTVTGASGKVVLPLDKFHDFLATARILGMKTGKI